MSMRDDIGAGPRDPELQARLDEMMVCPCSCHGKRRFVHGFSARAEGEHATLGECMEASKHLYETTEDEAADRIYDGDVETVRALLFDLAEGLATLGLTGQGDDEIKITVCCFSRLGVPIHVEG